MRFLVLLPGSPKRCARDLRRNQRVLNVTITLLSGEQSSSLRTFAYSSRSLR